MPADFRFCKDDPMPKIFRKLLLRLAPVPILFGSALAAYVCSPSLRLALHADEVSRISKSEWVDPHRYDREWFDAARAGRIDILSALVDAHYPIDAKTPAGYTALILSAYDEQPAALDYLLTKGADPCLTDRNGNTALMGALYKGELAIAKRLLETRCGIDQTNNAGETALSFASLFGRLDMLPLLVKKGADPNHRDVHGNTALKIASDQANTSAASALRAAGASL